MDDVSDNALALNRTISEVKSPNQVNEPLMIKQTTINIQHRMGMGVLICAESAHGDAIPAHGFSFSRKSSQSSFV